MRQTLIVLMLTALLPLAAGCDDTSSTGAATPAGNTGDAATDTVDTGDPGASAAAALPGGVVASADRVAPLGVGDAVPAVTVHSTRGEPIALADYVKRKPTVLVFYRGGWCPFCTKHLAALGESYGQLREMGYQLLAISPDTPRNAAETVTRNDAPFTLASDSTIEATRAFGLAFKVDDATIHKYVEYGIDLQEASGQPHHVLPVPAVYIVDTAGVIRYRHFDPDYKQRLEPAKVIAAAEAALE